MMHPAALIESGDWSAAKPEVSYAAGKRCGLQMKVINAALEYLLIVEQCSAFFSKAKYDATKARQLEKRNDERLADLMAACDELLKLVPNVDRRPHPAKRKAVRA